ncbi:MAG: hypothetical protein KBF93_18525 [Leptospiraceae bacterium]|nr:hypothetical protein [Leptospiraceae bacterium]
MMDDQITIDKYIEASVESSNRSRYLVIVLIVLSIFSFVQYWNHRKNNWHQANSNYLKVLNTYFSLRQVLLENEIDKTAKEKNKDISRFEDIGDAKDVKKDEKLDKMAGISKKAREYLKKYREDEDEYLGKILDYNRDRKVYYDSPFLNKVKLDQFKEYSRIQNQESGKLDVIESPFFHVSFHAYDLSIFSGISFTALLILLCFSKFRELKNIRIVFNQCKKDKALLKKVYILLSMRQVLTVPPSLKAHSVNSKILSFLPMLILALAPIVQVIMCYEVFANFGDWYYLEPILVITQLVLSFGFCILVISFSIWSFILSSQLDEVWRDNANEIIS